MKRKMIFLNTIVMCVITGQSIQAFLVAYAKQKRVMRQMKKQVVQKSKRHKTNKKKIYRNKSNSESSSFSLTSCSVERLRRAIIEQAHCVFSKGLQTVGVSQWEADSITASVVDLVRKGYELSEQVTKELTEATTRKSTLDAITRKTAEQMHESEQLVDRIKELQEKKLNKEKSIKMIASSLSISIAKIGLGAHSEKAITQLLEQCKIPGLEYATITSEIAVQLWKGIQELQKESYVGSLKKYMKYYIGDTEKSVGGWFFGQDRVTGKIYVRLDTPCTTWDDYVHVIHRELVLKHAYPFREIGKQLGQVMAGEFELGDSHMKHVGRNRLVRILGWE